MCNNNVPDDWDNFWTKCEKCGNRWHLSEGQSCEKCECIREEWLQNHCVLCEREFEIDEEVYPWDDKEEDACICYDCAEEEGIFDNNEEDITNPICYSCSNESIVFCRTCQRPICTNHAHLSRQAGEFICTGCALR